MAAVKNLSQTSAPYVLAVKDGVTSVDSPVEVNITIRLVGTVAQVQADWATLIAATITSTTSFASWAGGQG
jgi:hypothetical protein